LQPVVDSTNPLLINVPLPPPTKESRDANAKKAGQVLNKALEGLKSARLATHKKIMSVRKVRPDEVAKADKKMEDITKKRKAEMEKTAAAAQKEIMQS
jgi:ribosome recycling factor